MKAAVLFLASLMALVPSGANAQAPGTAVQAPSALPPESEMEAAGQLAAARWLLLLDRRDWGTAWETASPFFKASVPIGQWMDGIPKVREPVSTIVERTPEVAAYRTSLEGRPPGDYVTVLFQSRFSARPEPVQETVTTVREADGAWRVLGYSTR